MKQYFMNNLIICIIKYHPKLKSSIILILIMLIFSSCMYKEGSDTLHSWQGKYFYQEEPIQAIAGYYMAMEWELDIHKATDTYKAKLEVNGQQTLIDLECEIAGDENEISIMFSKKIDESLENFQHGDTLFKLRREGKELITVWANLESRLAEKVPKECSCFQQLK